MILSKKQSSFFIFIIILFSIIYLSLSDNTDFPNGRYGHASVIVDKNLYIYGGYNVKVENNKTPNSVDLKYFVNDLWKCNLTDNSTCELLWNVYNVTENESFPVARAFHSMNSLDANTLVIFGGMPFQSRFIVLACGLNDIWKFEITQQKWTIIQNNTEDCPPKNSKHENNNNNNSKNSSNNIGRGTLWTIFIIGTCAILLIISIYVWKEVQKRRKHRYSGVEINQRVNDNT